MLKNLIKKIIPSFLIRYYHFSLSFLGAFFYGFPSKKIKIIGITGTNGKSTVVGLTTRILEQSGYRVAMVSTMKFKINEKEWKNELKMTMPGRFKLQKFFRQALKANCQYVVLEVTSEGILQFRHRFINFDIALFTNLSPEHIERHGSFEKYRQAKGKLFQACKEIHVINTDDKNSNYFLKFPANKKYVYSANKNLKIKELEIDWKLEIGNWKFIKATDINLSSGRIGFRVGNISFHLNLLGGFNVYNALAAICIGLSQGIDLEVCKKVLEKVKTIPGRMEIVVERPFRVIVDYAHTPDSLEKVYETLSGISNSEKSRLICVLGSCGGGRDKWKRPKMGEIAARYCDEIILTNEDPYDENPQKIIEDIERGVLKIQNSKFNKNSKFKIQNYQEVLDRREAIKKALTLAHTNNIVVITGKGSEPWMCVDNGRKIPWDDREIVKNEFNKLKHD